MQPLRYHALKLLRDALGTHTLRCELRGVGAAGGAGGATALTAAASRLSADGRRIAVKLAHYDRAPRDVEVALRGAGPLAAAWATTLTADGPDALNRMGDPARGEPEVVEPAAPGELPLESGGEASAHGRLRVRLPAWSVTVVHVELGSGAFL